MTVGELIEKLSSFDPWLKVVVDGYEGGLCDPKTVVHVPIIVGQKKEFCGDHEFAKSSSVLKDGELCEDVVLLPRDHFDDDGELWPGAVLPPEK